MPDELPVHLRRTPADALAPALRHIEANFRKRLWETDLARMCDLSTSEFSREFHRVVGTTFVDHVTTLRIREAQRLLRQPGATVTDVSYAVGFSDPSYFGRAFRRRVGDSLDSGRVGCWHVAAWRFRAAERDHLVVVHRAGRVVATSDDAAAGRHLWCAWLVRRGWCRVAPATR